MSAPHLQLYALPEYEPPLCLVPPDPDQPPPDWTPPLPIPLPPIADRPVWDEPGPLRTRSHHLLRLVLEVLDGRRPLTQLRGAITGPVYTALFTRCRHSTGHHHRLHTLRTCRPSPTAIELCATVQVLTPPKHPTVIALAARLELRHNRWICTVLRPLYPNPRPH